LFDPFARPSLSAEVAMSTASSVLLIDDDDAVRRTMSKMLTRAGFDVTAISGGEPALAALLLQGYLFSKPDQRFRRESIFPEHVVQDAST
jgi:CheY-like chemotaxis protein